MSDLRAEEILESLDNEQRAVALATRGPVCVIAGAGTGKTRAITHRIAYAAAINVMDPHKVLALTFTARAAGEMRMRLDHSVFHRLLPALFTQLPLSSSPFFGHKYLVVAHQI